MLEKILKFICWPIMVNRIVCFNAKNFVKKNKIFDAQKKSILLQLESDISVAFLGSIRSAGREEKFKAERKSYQVKQIIYHKNMI